jgi:type IV secretory pathway VirB2 component (pilin)
LLPADRTAKAIALLGVLVVIVGAVGTFSHSLGWLWALMVLAGLGLVMYADRWNRTHGSRRR